LGDVAMKDINRELLQNMVARKRQTLGAKSVRNLIALLREMWTQAKADGYTELDPFSALVLLETDLLNELSLTLNEMKLVIDRAQEPAFRHGNASVMDVEHVPMATRQNRLGHSDPRTTMKYTHTISEDGRKIAARLGELLASSPLAATMQSGKCLEFWCQMVPNSRFEGDVSDSLRGMDLNHRPLGYEPRRSI
jgi:hypothetical protein